MKRKLRLIVVSLLAVTMIAALLTGCKFVFNDLTAISLVGQPKTQYNLGDEFDTTGFKVELHYGDTVNTVNYKNNIVEFENDFSSAKVGNYKCTISVKGDNTLKFSFDYSVVDPESPFAEGDGSLNSPYVVTTAEQFKHIGDESGKYYKLGNDIDLTAGTPYTGSWYTCYNKNSNPFVLDGSNYTLTIGGKSCDFLFNTVKNSTLKNFTLNLKPGSVEDAIALYVYGEVTFDGITTNGTMVAEQNDGLFCLYTSANKLTFKNCINNVNFTGTSVYYGVFCGFVNTKVNEITFENCTNNGNLEGSSAWLFIGNCAHNVNSITVRNCVNNGKLTGAAVGLFNCFGKDGKTAYATAADYAGTKLATTLKECSITASADKYVSISAYKLNNGKDVTLVNDNGTVKFASDVKTKLDEKFGEGKYTVKALVRDWVNYGPNDNTVYMFSDMFGLDCAIPYSGVEMGEGSSDTVNGAITIENGKLKVVKTYQDTAISLKGTTNYQSYCYYIYDESGAMKYCGQIKFADIQNA